MTRWYLNFVIGLHRLMMKIDSFIMFRAAGWYNHSRRQKLWAHTELKKMTPITDEELKSQ